MRIIPLFDSKTYAYKHILIDLSLWRNSTVPKISPVIGDQNALYGTGDLSIKMDYSTAFTDKTGLWIFCLIYEDKQLMLNLKDGYYFNPLLT